MSYATLMVYAQLGQPNEGLLQIAGDLAERFNAALIGITACQPMQIAYSEGYYAGDLFEQDRKKIQQEIQEAETVFRDALSTRIKRLEWRSEVTYGSLTDYIARETRSADLVITGSAPPNFPDNTREVNTGELVLKVGRPVLVVPLSAKKITLDRVVVGWKDTRETRHAIADALPLLKKASHVAIAEIADESDRAEALKRAQDVVVWLSRHGVKAEALSPLSDGDAAIMLINIAREQHADVVVAGAYGHSRLREWALGGVTRNLLLQTECCKMMSH
jgi:nucleotide-binding universal stress UspA family protein